MRKCLSILTVYALVAEFTLPGALQISNWTTDQTQYRHAHVHSHHGHVHTHWHSHADPATDPAKDYGNDHHDTLQDSRGAPEPILLTISRRPNRRFNDFNFATPVMAATGHFRPSAPEPDAPKRPPRDPPGDVCSPHLPPTVVLLI